MSPLLRLHRARPGTRMMAQRPLGRWHGMAWHGMACTRLHCRFPSPTRAKEQNNGGCALGPSLSSLLDLPSADGLVGALPGYVTLASGSKDRRPPPQALPMLYMRSHKRILFSLVQTFDSLQ